MKSRVRIHGATLAVCIVFAVLGAATSAPPADPNRSTTDPARTTVAARPPIQNPMQLVALEVRIPYSKPNGRAWDVGEGAPDPLIHVRQDGYEIYTSPVVQDRFTARFELDPPIELDRTTNFEVEVIDKDVAANDPVGTARFIPLTRTGAFFARMEEGGRVRVEVRDPQATTQAPPGTLPPAAVQAIAAARAAIAARDFDALRRLLEDHGDYAIGNALFTRSADAAIAAWRRDPALVRKIEGALSGTCQTDNAAEDEDWIVLCASGEGVERVDVFISHMSQGDVITSVHFGD